MFGLGLSEIIFIAVLALIFIGPKQLPEVARTVGRFLNELKRSTSELTDELKASAKIDRIDLYGAPPKPQPPAGAATPAETANATENTGDTAVSAHNVKFEIAPEAPVAEDLPMVTEPEKKDV